MQMAMEAIKTGKAREKLMELIKSSNA